jgi:hypothetical protein
MNLNISNHWTNTLKHNHTGMDISLEISFLLPEYVTQLYR